MADLIRVTVDPDRCRGRGRCRIMAPEIFQLDADGHCRVDGEFPASLARKAATAAQVCPERAITVAPAEPR